MQRHTIAAAGVLTVMLATASTVDGQTTAASGVETTQQDDDRSLVEVRGLFDAGVRWRGVSGNEDKYREDLNYGTGPRLFNADLTFAPRENEAVDIVSLYTTQLGDPYESLGMTITKYGGFTFRFRRRTSAYFYRDTILPVELSNPNQSDAGDFHTFDFERTNDRIAFDVRLGRRSKVFVAFNRQTRQGNSTTTLDISRDEFELDRPLSEVKNDYTVGFQTALEKVSFVVDNTYRDYDNDVRLFLPGASIGENPDNLTELFFYEQLTPFDFTMPQTSARVNVRPTTRLTVTGGYVYSDLRGDFTHRDVTRGVSFLGQPLDDASSGGGQLDRTTKMADLDLAYDVTDRVALIGGIRFNRFDQVADAGAISDGEQTGLDIASDIIEAGAQVVPAPGVTVTGGLRYEERTVSTVVAPDRAEDTDDADASNAAMTTERTTMFVTAAATLSSALNVTAEYERGSYDNPFTLLAPTALDRVKARVRYRPLDSLALTGVFFTRRLENDVSGRTLFPDARRIGDPTMLNSTDLTLHAAYGDEATMLYGGYTRREISNEVSNVIDAGGTAFSYAARYQSDLDRLFGGIRVELTKAVAVGSDLASYRNRGSFGLDWDQYRLYGELLSPAGYLMRLSYQYNALDERDFAWDDYHAHMVTVSAGYRF